MEKIRWHEMLTMPTNVPYNILGVLPIILAIAFMASFMSSGVKNPIIRFVDLEGYYSALLCLLPCFTAGTSRANASTSVYQK